MARLVVLGDSLALGGRSFAVSDSRTSFPALLAGSLGLDSNQFRTPDFSAHGGLPLNLEWLARRLEETFGDHLPWFSWPAAAMHILDWLGEVRRGWRHAPPQEDVLYHNLAVWGGHVKTAWHVTSDMARQEADHRPDDAMHWPSQAMLQIVQRVLNPSGRPERSHDTMVDIAGHIAEQEGGIDHLIVALGANNCLRSIVELSLREPVEVDVPVSGDYTMWTTEAFAFEYSRLAEEVRRLGARHVYLGTIPHASVSPMLTGFCDEEGPRTDRYYDRYVHMRPAGSFNPSVHPHLTGDQMRTLDSRVDSFNDIIRRTAAEERWTVVDVCALFDDLVSARERVLPRPLADLSMDMLTVHDGRLVKGGLMSLDAFHPTACCSALVAQRYLEALQPHEPRLAPLDWAAIRAADSLVSRPPTVLPDLSEMLACLQTRLGIGRLLTRWTRVAEAA